MSEPQLEAADRIMHFARGVTAENADQLLLDAVTLARCVSETPAEATQKTYACPVCGGWVLTVTVDSGAGPAEQSEVYLRGWEEAREACKAECTKPVISSNYQPLLPPEIRDRPRNWAEIENAIAALKPKGATS